MAQLRDARTSELLVEGDATFVAAIAAQLTGETLFDGVGALRPPEALEAAEADGDAPVPKAADVAKARQAQADAIARVKRTKP